MKKYDLNILLTNQCNLECFSCDHYCGYNNDHYYISLNDLEKNIKIIKQKMKNLQNIILIGGEPLLHPQIIEICTLLRKYFPKKQISIGTNGIKLFNFNTSKIEFLVKKLMIDINISIYPLYLKEYDILFDTLEKNNIPFGYQCSKVNFSKITLDKNGNQKQNDSTLCEKMKGDFIFTLYKNKIYSCCVSCCMDAFNFSEEENIDYINIFSLQNELNLFNLFKIKQNRCKYCVCSSEPIIWHKYKNKNNLFKTLKELFLYDYNEYEYIKNDLSDVKDILINKKYLNLIDKNFKYETQKIIDRYYSKKDIFILIDSNNFNIKSIMNLDNKYNNENIYIVLFKNNLNNLEKFYDIFNRENTKNNYFLYRIFNLQNFFALLNNKSYGKNKQIEELK